MVTENLLRRLGLREQLIPSYIGPLNAAMADAEINTPLRAAHFLAQGIAESSWDRFREIPSQYASSGWRYRGRGFGQVTGGANSPGNYAAYYDDLRRRFGARAPNVVRNPEILERLPWAFDSAGWYWRANNIGRLADRGDTYDDVFRVSQAWNLGPGRVGSRVQPHNAAGRWETFQRVYPIVQAEWRTASTPNLPDVRETPLFYLGGDGRGTCLGLNCGPYSPPLPGAPTGIGVGTGVWESLQELLRGDVPPPDVAQGPRVGVVGAPLADWLRDHLYGGNAPPFTPGAPAPGPLGIPLLAWLGGAGLLAGAAYVALSESRA
jgi:putative chitinase